MAQKETPYEFIRKKTKLEWKEVLWGLKNGFLNIESVAEVARDKLEQGSEDWNLIELINLHKKDSEGVFEIVKQLAKMENIDEQSSDFEDKWTYLFLNWVYETHSFDDFYKILFDYYFENLAPKKLEKLLNFKKISAGKIPSLRKQRMEIKKNVREYFLENQSMYALN